MPTTKQRYNVLIPESVVCSLRERAINEYPNVKGIPEASTTNLIRFVVAINAGLPVATAEKWLGNLTGRYSELDKLSD